MSVDSAFWDYLGLEPVRVQMQTREVQAPEFERRLAEQKEEIERSIREGKRAFVVIEARGVGRPSPQIRKLQAQWMSDNAELLQRNTVGIAFVITERMVRGALTAIFWMTRNPVPYTVHGSLRDALDHAAEQCTAAGLELPPGMRDDPAGLVEEALASHLRRTG